MDNQQNTMNDVATVNIKIIARKFKRKSDGSEFTAYRAVQRDGKLVECHFRKACGAIPDTSFIATVPRTDVKMDYSHEYPRVWLHSIASIVTLAEQWVTVEADDLPF